MYTINVIKRAILPQMLASNATNSYFVMLIAYAMPLEMWNALGLS